MKSNRILQIVLIALVVVFLATGGYLYYANSQDSKQITTLNSEIAKNKVTVNKSLADKATKNTEAATLDTQLASAKAALAKINFRSSSESIEYDKLLFSIAADSKLQVTGLTATPVSLIKEGAVTYQQTTFTINLQAFVPDKIFANGKEDTDYINTNINNILAFIHSVAANPNFDTAVMDTVNMTAPKPMSDEEVLALIDSINTRVYGQMSEADKTTLSNNIAQIIAAQNAALTVPLTDAQMLAINKTETDKAVAARLAALTPDQLKVLLEESTIGKPAAAITINIWTYKGA
jgi:cell division protein FtsB